MTSDALRDRFFANEFIANVRVRRFVESEWSDLVECLRLLCEEWPDQAQVDKDIAQHLYVLDDIVRYAAARSSGKVDPFLLELATVLQNLTLLVYDGRWEDPPELGPLAPPEPSETLLKGRWLDADGSMRADETAQRIGWLASQHLVRITTSPDGWSDLLRDPRDGRYWELSYPSSDQHGGGPPQLAVISPDDARGRYDAPDLSDSPAERD